MGKVPPSMLCALVILCATPMASARHGPIHLDRKTHYADVIAVGVVSDVRDVESRRPRGLFDNFRQMAVVRVDQYVKNALPAKSVHVGFRSTYACDMSRLEVGKRYLLFLRKTSGVMFGTVQWEWGIVEVEDGRVWHPTQPSSYKGSWVPLDQAVDSIRKLVAEQAASFRDVPAGPYVGDATSFFFAEPPPSVSPKDPWLVRSLGIAGAAFVLLCLLGVARGVRQQRPAAERSRLLCDSQSDGAVD